MNQNVRSIAEGYTQHFQIIPASDDALRRQCFRIRHEVYCQELGYEPTRLDQHEVDPFDASALHCLIQTTETRQFIGCARLLISSPTWEDPRLPFERLCQGRLAPGLDAFIDAHRNSIAEVSRLAVTPTFRRTRTPNPAMSAPPARIRLPYLTLGLYLGLIAMARQQGIKHLFFLVERALAASIERNGWKLWAVGEPIEHRGERVPYLANLDQVMASMSPYMKLFYERVEAELTGLIPIADRKIG